MSPDFRIRRAGKWVTVTEEEFRAHQASSLQRSALGVQRSAFGLGDLVHAVAHPIAKTIDNLAGTNLAECGGCARRRAALNRAGAALSDKLKA